MVPPRKPCRTGASASASPSPARPSLLFLFLCIALATSLRVVPSMASTQRALALEACLEKGFNRETLKCSSCDKLAGAVGEKGEALVQDCQACCEEDEDDLEAAAGKYVRAELSLDEYFLRMVPELQSFLKSKQAEAWKESGMLSVHYRQGVRPNLQLFSLDQTTPGEIVSIAQWTAESITEFMDENLYEEEDEEEKEVLREEL